MRKSTLLWLVLAAGCASALFHTSQKTHDEKEKLVQLNTLIAKEEESLRVLNAEWGYLNQPERLEKLAKQYLKIGPMKGTQFAKLDDIPLRPTPAPAAAIAAVSPPVTETLVKPAEAEKPAPEKPVPEKPVPEKPVSEKPVSEKPAPPKTAALPVKIRKPTQTPHKSAAPKPVAAAADPERRHFSDLMKSLRTGVE